MGSSSESESGFVYGHSHGLGESEGSFNPYSFHGRGSSSSSGGKMGSSSSGGKMGSSSESESGFVYGHSHGLGESEGSFNPYSFHGRGSSSGSGGKMGSSSGGKMGSSSESESNSESESGFIYGHSHGLGESEGSYNPYSFHGRGSSSSSSSGGKMGSSSGGKMGSGSESESGFAYGHGHGASAGVSPHSAHFYSGILYGGESSGSSSGKMGSSSGGKMGSSSSGVPRGYGHYYGAHQHGPGGGGAMGAGGGGNGFGFHHHGNGFPGGPRDEVSSYSFTHNLYIRISPHVVVVVVLFRQPCDRRPTPINNRPTSAPTFLRASDARGNLLLVENFSRLVGNDLLNIILRTQPTSLGSLAITGFPVGSVIGYTDEVGNDVTAIVQSSGFVLELESSSIGSFFDVVESLQLLSGPIDADDFELQVDVTHRDDPTATQTIPVTVQILHVAEMPMVTANSNVVVPRDSSVPLNIDPMRSPDTDDSEFLSIEFVVARDNTGRPIGTLELRNNVNIPGVTFQQTGDGIYTATSSGPSAELRESALDLLLSDGVRFRPRDGISSGEFPSGIVVTAISTETSRKLRFQANARLYSPPLSF